MAMIRHFALGCCILCAAAGIVRIFWPENSFKPVINTVLLLYILTSALTLGRTTDWAALGTELRAGGWEAAASQSESENQKEYDDYAARLGQESTVSGLQALLQSRGVDADVSLQDGTCQVLLQSAGDKAVAEALLRQNSGELPYTIKTEEKAP